MFRTTCWEKKIPLDQNEEAGIIDQLEALLIDASGGDDGIGDKATNTTELLSSHLADYYRRQNRIDDVRRVIMLHGATIEATTISQSAIAASSLLRRLHKIYLNYGLATEADALLIRLREVSLNIRQELQSSTIESTIDRDELERFLDFIIGGQLEEALTNIAIHFTPDPVEAEAIVKNIAKGSALLNLIPKQLMDKEGRVVATVGAIQNDFEGNVVLQLSQNMSFGSQFLKLALEKVNGLWPYRSDAL